MKRMLLRVGALGLILVGGFFAIAQAQRIIGKPDDKAAKAEPAPTTPDGEPPAVADASNRYDIATPAKSAAPRDPFAGSRLLDAGGTAPQPKADLKPPAPLPRYADADKDANPLRSASLTAGPAQSLMRDAQVVGASHTDESAAAPPDSRKSPVRRDPFALDAPAVAAPLGSAAKMAPAPAGAAADERYGSDSERYADAPQPLPKNAAADMAAPRSQKTGGAVAGNLREVGSDPADARATSDLAASRRPVQEDRFANAGSRYGMEDAATPPHELPRDESLRSLGGRRPDTAGIGNAGLGAANLGTVGSSTAGNALSGIGAAGRSAATRGASRRDPSASRPGSRQLDGPQAPQVTVQKMAPAEIQVGAPATFQILVRNTGTIPAREVVVRDVIPEGTTLVSTSPQAQADGADLQWSLGTLQPSEEKSLSVKVMPQTEGEIGSVASVSFQAEATARTVATRPDLLVELTAPRQVMIGETVALSIRVSNNGSGVASGVVLNQKIPPQLQHEAGGELEFDVGDLKPRESKQVDLTLTAVKAGKVIDAIVARGQGGLVSKASAEMEVLAPAIEVSLDGPRRRFLEREATYTLTVANPGTAPAKDVELVSHLPKGLKFVSANNAGQYNQQTHAVYWSLAELPQGETGTVKLVTLPVEAGDQKLIIEGRADKNITQRQEEKIEIEGLAAIVFEVADVTDPIEVGGETAYEVRVINQGTRAADNVQVTALLPAELKGLAGEGPTRGTVDRDRVVFEPLARLAPKADTTYRIRVQALAPGDQRVRIQLKTDDMSAPVTKEESTRVFTDK